ncbi:late competence development ComFB family protein [Clostridium argentinense CDC 2741]|uniref:Late competence development ComFB family protein n=1 Tax=Clostridium argentinense CDC 2741 TaxID=1418104 RepID=A0A0C1U9N7_9CLOT|nr:competence protein ComFB [Clostridium argentinense]ARC83989.1 competence protein ComFB [Clostridium argentinense]KIE44320.1 late competence development ComFB family protein [Clostridium argentinense CDC 2741]NFF39406.1 competence protein ComFB [Clostridium argentinense]NFP50389.1 competence protein ComFB [Clostridium argentinense]NFP74191.1 competence protein ComFB [Clostridium argentinense]
MSREFLNYSEVIVKNLLDKLLLSYSDICKCEKCKADMMALSLNYVKPRYVVSEKGQLYTKAQTEINHGEMVVITSSVLRAIEVVSANPRHD